MAAQMLIEEMDGQSDDAESEISEIVPSNATRHAPPKQRMNSAYQESRGPSPRNSAPQNLAKNQGLKNCHDMPAVLPLNVGGYNYTTRLSTLCKYENSMLAAMFSGRHQLDKDQDGRYFIDSNGKYFGHILEFLRNETMPPVDVALDVYKEASYYGIAPLLDRLQTVPMVAGMLVREAHRLQFPNYNQTKDTIIKTAIANGTVNKTGEVLVYAFKKEFKARVPHFNCNHDCVVDTAHVSIGPWEAPPDEETLIRSLEQDLMEEGFKIKSHEQKKRCKYYNGQNCQKAVYKLTFLFY